MVCIGPRFPPSFTLGAKARGLVRLREAGVRVPDFVVIPAETFDPLLGATPPTDPAGAAEQRQRLSTFRLDEADQAALARVLQAWQFPAQPVVVRSSVVDEDGAQASFAGLMDSFVNIATVAALHDAIAQCAASAYSERARAYRQQQRLPAQARPAVIVQQQVLPESSGVCFSTFPEFPQELAVHAVWGFGEGLVGGHLQPDEWYIDKATGALTHEVIAPKPLAWRAVPAKPNLDAAPVDLPDQSAPCLSSGVRQEIFRVAQDLERFFGGPQDLEFVVAGGACWWVQARPITQPIQEVIVYDNSNIQESYCGVTTPLTFSFAQRAYATVYRQTMRVLGLPEARIKAMEPVVTALLGLVNGRIYYHINHWYEGLQLLPSFRQNKADLERMMGLEEPVDFVVNREKSWAEKLRLAPGLLVNLVRLLGAFRKLPKAVPAFQQHVAAQHRAFYAQSPDALSAAELLAWKDQLDSQVLLNWTTPIVNDFYVMMTNGRVMRRLRRAGHPAPDAWLSQYLAGDPDLASVQPTRALLALARQVSPGTELWTLLWQSPPDVHARVRRLAPAFYEQVRDFIHQYGDRTVGELKLETRTMRVDPLVFYKYLRNYLGEVRTGLTTPPQPSVAKLPRGLRADLQRLRRAIGYREAMRLERTRLFGMYRALYLAAGQRLAAGAVLEAPRDVFYLTETELTTALAGAATDFRSLVGKRQTEFARYATQDTPARVVVPQRPRQAAPAAGPAGTLHGTGCVAGQAEGLVRVITDPADDLDVQDRIVCALRTDPGWAALFPMCRGVIIEKGSSLSHSVILLRELGIPTIINIPGLTRQFRSDDRVRLNGATGAIERLS
jgi:phosphohistidine swiveling domain-containing protein